MKYFRWLLMACVYAGLMLIANINTIEEYILFIGLLTINEFVCGTYVRYEEII